MAKRRFAPYVHVTWLAKWIAGDTNCDWSVWFRSRFSNWKTAGQPLPASWKVRHNLLARRWAAERMPEGAVRLVESQAHFKLRRPSGLTLAGQPDLVLVQPEPLIVEFKTGKEQAAHQLQTMLYMWAAISTIDGITDTPDGLVVYPDKEVEIPAEGVDADFVDAINYYLERVENASPLEKRPSAGECRFCNIGPGDCPDRIDEEGLKPRLYATSHPDALRSSHPP